MSLQKSKNTWTQNLYSNVLRLFSQLHKLWYNLYINYGIIAWGGLYKDNMTRLQNIQTRILKIIHKNCFVENTPLNIRQVFTSEALMYHYVDLEKKNIQKK